MIALTPDQLYQLTHRRRASAQVQALAKMGVPYWVRPDGTPFVHADFWRPDKETDANEWVVKV